MIEFSSIADELLNTCLLYDNEVKFISVCYLSIHFTRDLCMCFFQMSAVLFKATVKSFFQKKSEFFFLHHTMQLFMTFPKN